MTVEVKIAKPNGTPLAHITASAEAPREDEKDRPELRALSAAADKIVKYLEEHRGSRPAEDKKAGKQGAKKTGKDEK